MKSRHSRRSFDFASLPEHEILQLQLTAAEMAGIDNPFFRVHNRRAADTADVAGQRLINFASYDYLGLNGSRDVSGAAKSAIDLFGTSVGASRVVAGERQLHRDLEEALAALHGVDAALTFVSGHATNVTTIGTLLGPQDLIVADALVHNSIVEGSRLSGAKKFLTPHGDYDAIERALRVHRGRHRRALIAVEGLYSMEGDVPDLARLIEIKRRYDAWLFVDEAHSIGVLGATGRGIAEEQSIDPRDVEIWMGTLSKAFAASGGYISGDRALIDLLKTSAPGFVYSVGLSPPIAAAALAAIGQLAREPQRVRQLRANGQRFRDLASAAGLDTGPSIGAAVVPIIIGESPLAVVLSNRLFARGINALPIIFPAVAERQARLRFFLTARHTEQQIDTAVAAIVDELGILKTEPAFAERIAAAVEGTDKLRPAAS
jgi:8-amino-7-oxononanoate synthase